MRKILSALVVFLMLLAAVSPLMSMEQVERIARKFISAFLEQETFSSIEPYFFTVRDIDNFLTMVRDLRGKESDPGRRRDLDKLLDEFGNPDKREKMEKEIAKGVEDARRRWQFMLRYPADSGEKVVLEEIRVSIRFKPLKYYEVRVRGHYRHGGKRQTFMVRADYFELDGKVRIVKFR